MYQSRIRAGKRKNEKKRELHEVEEGQEYGVVQDMLGNGRVRVYCEDKTVRVGRIRGSMRKFSGKVIIERGDLVVVSARDFEPDKLDIIHKYTHEEVAQLIRNEDVPENILKMIHADIDDEDTKKVDDYVMFVGEDVEHPAEPSVDSDVDIDAI